MSLSSILASRPSGALIASNRYSSSRYVEPFVKGSSKRGRIFGQQQRHEYSHYGRATSGHSSLIPSRFWDDREDRNNRTVPYPFVNVTLGQHQQPYQLQQQRAYYHTSHPSERAAAIILGLGALSAVSYAGATAVKAYKEYQASIPDTPPAASEQEETTEKVQEEPAQESTASSKTDKKAADSSGPRENIFVKWFDMETGYYEGGFEEKMTKQEAALILGVRQSSSPARIKEAHRKLLILNHPDTGGSTYIAGKINEAKELLLKGRRGV